MGRARAAGPPLVCNGACPNKHSYGDRRPELVGLQGRVTGRIAPGLVGEVMVKVRGGAEAFMAYAADPGERIAPGAIVVVMEYHPPRTVYVTAL